MNRIHNYIKYAVLTVATLLLNACNLDINTDPNNPSSVNNGQLLTNAQLDIVNSPSVQGLRASPTRRAYLCIR